MFAILPLSLGAVALYFAGVWILGRKARALPIEHYLHAVTHDWEKNTTLITKLRSHVKIWIPSWIFRDKMEELMREGKIEREIRPTHSYDGDDENTPWYRLAPIEK